MQAVQHYLTIDLLRQTYDQKIYIHNGAVGHRLTVILTQGGKVIDLPDAEHGIVQLVYQKPDGTKSDVEMTVTGKAASVMIPRTATDTVGEVDCEVRVYATDAEGTWTTTPRFTLDVENVIYDEDAQQEIVSDPTVYEQIVSKEAERRENEETRKDNEEQRKDKEEERQDNEEERQANEDIRKANEEARIAGGAITRADVDSSLSGTSVNPVQNKIIKTALDLKQNTDDIDGTLSLNSSRPVKNKTIKYALDQKQDTLTWDDAPTQNSNNPVKSGGIYTAIQNGGTVISGSFTLDAQRTGAEVAYSSIRQIGGIVYVKLMIDLNAGIGSNSVVLGSISGVAGPADLMAVVPCLTGRSGAGYHLGYATFGIGAVAVGSADPDDEYVYIETCYQAATS